MPNIKINGKDHSVADGITIIQACDELGIEIPRFCYHKDLKIAGNCRMCLVQVEKAPKPVASCAQQVTEGMVIHTDNQYTKDAREGVMEFLLINHPLDCPICDQGGECDLQDQAMKYGKGSSRYTEEKRAVKKKYMGPLIETFMTRCIHCTRCVRFLEDIAGTNELGTIGRGESMEITTYIEKGITSEVSGNIIDLCPVGALTSKPYAFKARSWELTHTESIDALDAVGSNIRIDSRGREIMRILPRANKQINGDWISDKTRFSYDGLKYQRLDTPMTKEGGRFRSASWKAVYENIAKHIKATDGNRIGAIAGDLTDIETMFVMKQLLDAIGGHYDCRQTGSNLRRGNRSSYLFNTGIKNIENMDGCLIIGSNPRHEAAILNTQIRKAVIENNAKIWLVGEKIDFNYPYKYLGNDPLVLERLAQGNSSHSGALKKCKNPMLIIGENTFKRDDVESVLHYLYAIAEKYNMIRDDWVGFNILHNAASRVGGLDIGFVPSGAELDYVKGKLTPSNHASVKNKGATKGAAGILTDCDVIFLLGADEVDIDSINPNALVVYIGHHGDRAASRADIILPGAAYTEKSGMYVNLEGKAQRTSRAVFPLGEAKEDWRIINEIGVAIGVLKGYCEHEELYHAICKEFPALDVANQPGNDDSEYKQRAKDVMENAKIYKTANGKLSDEQFNLPIRDFYMTNSISRNSPTMTKCSTELCRGDKEAV